MNEIPCRPSAAKSVPPSVELLVIDGECFVSAVEAGGVGAAADDLDADYGVAVVVEKLQPLVRLATDDSDGRVLRNSCKKVQFSLFFKFVARLIFANSVSHLNSNIQRAWDPDMMISEFTARAETVFR